MCAAVALCIVLGSLLLVAGCIERQPAFGNSTANETVTSTPSTLITQTVQTQCPSQENMTFWQKKLPTPILEIIDPNAPLSGMTRNEIRKQLILEENLMPTDEVFTKLGVRQPTGDLVKVTINVNSSVSTQIVDPYVIYLIGKRSNLVDAWVDINTIEKIASLDEVKWIDLIRLSIHQGDNPSASPSTKLRDTQPIMTLSDTSKIPSTILTSLPVVPSKTNTSASALSFTGIPTVLICFGLIILMYRTRVKRK